MDKGTCVSSVYIHNSNRTHHTKGEPQHDYRLKTYRA